MGSDGSLAYKNAARNARVSIYCATQPGTDVLEALCRKARALAPDCAHERQWDRILAAFGQGHRFKTSTYPAVIAVGGDAGHVELIADVESAFAEGGE